MAGVRAHPTWEEIQGYMDDEAPSLHVVDGSPYVALFIDEGGHRLGLRIAEDSPQLDLEEPLAEIEIDAVERSGRRCIELSTRNRPLLPYFYAFAVRLADRIQLEHGSVDEAIHGAMENWRLLMRQATMLSAERILGLIGELWLLGRLESSLGSPALDAWTGPHGEAHDFRLASHEIEVKTTRGERRIHTINGVQQLVPSEGSSLHVLSLQFAAAGAGEGTSLSELISAVRERFAAHSRAADFSALISGSFGIAPEREGYYRERVKLRSSPALIAVDDDLPRITQADLDAIQRPEMHRITDVHFRLDLTGLGALDGRDDFLAVIPAEATS